MQAFSDTLRNNGYDVEYISAAPNTEGLPSVARLSNVLRELSPTDVSVYDVADDWLSRDCLNAAREAGISLTRSNVLESPNFLTSRPDIEEQFASPTVRMQHFYQWQRRRRDILMEEGQPVGGKWSYDHENRKKLPRGHHVPAPHLEASADKHVAQAIEWVAEHFPDVPGDPSTFCWPTTHADAMAWFDRFLSERFDQFGPYEDAVSQKHPVIFHAAITPALNIGLISPADMVTSAISAYRTGRIPLACAEGFIRQVIGWREYMRATYRRFGRSMRTSNHLGHHRRLGPGWWDASTGIEPLDHVIGQVLERGWCHHIERLMVLGNAMCLLRIHPDDVYRWFMEMFVDAYDWVMVPNVYGMSQFAAADSMTTKPYVSGSAYLKRMTDFGPGPWREVWDGLYWSFVEEHRELLAGNHRTKMVTTLLDRLDPSVRDGHMMRAEKTLSDSCLVIP